MEVCISLPLLPSTLLALTLTLPLCHDVHDDNGVWIVDMYGLIEKWEQRWVQ
jgi:hypothetical protein